MTIFLNGKKYVKAYLDGKEFTTAYFNNKLVMLMPDYNKYLLAKKNVFLRLGKNYFWGFGNTPQVVCDHLSTSALGRAPFEIQFAVNPQNAGTHYLFELAGVVRVKSEAATLAFAFAWDTVPRWKNLPAGILLTGWNTVLLKQDGQQMVLTVNGKNFTLHNSAEELPSLTCGKLKVWADWEEIKNLKLTKGA